MDEVDIYQILCVLKSCREDLKGDIKSNTIEISFIDRHSTRAAQNEEECVNTTDDSIRGQSGD